MPESGGLGGLGGGICGDVWDGFSVAGERPYSFAMGRVVGVDGAAETSVFENLEVAFGMVSAGFGTRGTLSAMPFAIVFQCDQL